MLESLSTLEKINGIEDLPLDNYRVSSDTLTEVAKDHLLENSNLPGVIITEGDQVIGSISRRALFEKLSKEFSLALYATKPIQVILKSFKGDILKVPAHTSINDAVKLCLCRPLKLIYDPLIVVKEGQTVGMLDFSKLILAQSEMFSTFNQQLMQQEEEIRNYAIQVEEQGKNVQQYAVQLEIQQEELKQRNTLLEEQELLLRTQANELSSKVLELSQKTEEVSSLNQRFEEVGTLLAQEGERTLSELKKGVETVIELTQKINFMSEDFQEKLTIINRGNELINKISKRVENLSLQASMTGAHFPADSAYKVPFNMIIDEIEKLSIQILEANTTSDKISKQIYSQIHVLVKTAQESQEVVKALSKNSQTTETALVSLSDLLKRI
ncbi:MAG: hypothetical protein VKJ02_05510 [Snowella sp.]|nr:hypothetical protein [Snowella sp.]